MSGGNKYKNNNSDDIFKALARELSKLKPEERDKIIKKLSDIKDDLNKKPDGKN
jgi:CRISPR/Cas system CSM-associated protein Csm4 (group 5 of RAMP superfamily)